MARSMTPTLEVFEDQKMDQAFWGEPNPNIVLRLGY
jgi:hypothetical protein